jgi:hypothetical protein
MATVRVGSIDSIKEFRAYMAKFQESAGIGLGEADSDINKTVSWLEGEQQTFWAGQIRKRQDLVTRAEDAVRQKRIFKDSSGTTPSAVDEMKQLAIVKKSLAEAQQKQVNVKKALQRLQKELTLYRGGVARFAGAVSSVVPNAVAQLRNTIEMLEKYTGMAPELAGAEMGGSDYAAAGGGAGGGMARPTDETQAETPDASSDPAAIRQAVPKISELGGAVELPGELFKPVAAELSAQQREGIAANFTGSPPADEATIVISAAGMNSAKLAFMRLEYIDGQTPIGWFGSVDLDSNSESNSVTVADIRKNRPDLADLLMLPIGWIAVLGANGLVGLYDDQNQSRFG